MFCGPVVTKCTLTGGETVAHGWSGHDTGLNYCNSCNCDNGRLACTKMLCLPRDCTLAGGETVVHGLSGDDTGANYCNTCNCNNGQLACTKKACLSEQYCKDHI